MNASNSGELELIREINGIFYFLTEDGYEAFGKKAKCLYTVTGKDIDSVEKVMHGIIN